jgi:hypothetical protein
MGVISSRTPEGQPNVCPVCGRPARVEPACLSPDAPCPSCGHLLWFPFAAPGAVAGSKVMPTGVSLDLFMALAQLCSLATVRFGQPRPEHIEAVMRITEPARLGELTERCLTAGSWDELLAAGGDAKR